MSRAERVESELVSLADWIERYFASRDLLPPPAIAAGVASARAALALPADEAVVKDPAASAARYLWERADEIQRSGEPASAVNELREAAHLIQTWSPDFDGIVERGEWLSTTPPAQPAQAGVAVVLLMDVLDALVDCVDGTNSPRHASLEDRVRAFVNRSLPTKLQALPRTHPTPRAEAYVEWCARHANIEKVPGPFCPACAYASVMRDGVKMGRESAPRAASASAEAVAREAARYAMDDTARILSFGGVPRIEDIAAAKTGIVDRAVAYALRAKGAR